MATSDLTTSLQTGVEARRAARSGVHRGSTCLLAPNYIQANLLVVPSRYADDFRLLCTRNPVPCPLLAESAYPGAATKFISHLPNISDAEFSRDFDVRQDAPRYVVFKDGEITKDHCLDIMNEWTDDHVAFLIGCSFSFETSLVNAGLTPLHMLRDRLVPVYKTGLPLLPAGVFVDSHYVVSMRPYKKAEIDRVREITKPFAKTHGCPIAWGWDAVEKLGIKDFNNPEWGDKPIAQNGQDLTTDNPEGLVPVFWGCGVTPQQAVMDAKLEGVLMSHAAGHMIVLDLQADDIIKRTKL